MLSNGTAGGPKESSDLICPGHLNVGIKTEEQLDLQALHRVRDRLEHRRTAVINQIRVGTLLN
jgi:hypothetical protein